MGELREMENWLTAKDLAKKWGKTTRTINGWWNETFREIEFDVNAKISPERINALREKYIKGKAKNGAKKIPKPLPPAEEGREYGGPAPSRITWPNAAQIRSALFNILAVGVVVGHGALIWVECSELWGLVGFFGGLVVFMVVLLAVLLASDPSKNRTSSYALWFMLVVDSAAYWVHYPSFVNYSVSDSVRTGICIFICACSFMALLLFRDSKLD